MINIMIEAHIVSIVQSWSASLSLNAYGLCDLSVNLHYHFMTNSNMMAWCIHKYLMLSLSLSFQLFQCNELAHKASKDVLCDLINGLITALIDDRLMSFDDGTQVVRSVNILMVKVVENADPNNALG